MRAELFAQILQEFASNSGDLEGMVVHSLDGLPIANLLPQGVKEDRASTMAAAMLSLGRRSAEELYRGKLERVLVQGHDGFIVMVQAGPQAVLTALVRQEAKLWRVSRDLRRAAVKIAELL